MAQRRGMRVLRGPDWDKGEEDGGEGHVGTVIEILVNNMVRVVWDNGKESICRSGAGGKFDLRIFDSAPVGVLHSDVTCSGCENDHIYGMLWHCKECKCCNLCSLCYVMDKHDLRHEFLRYSEPGNPGESMKKRSVSLKIRAMGIFPGSTVQRGKDWSWGNQDGGVGSIGHVEGFEDVAPNSSRNIMRVRWPNGNTNSYRLGYQGYVDLKCIEEEAGTYYYRDHLPVLSTVGVQEICESAVSGSNMRSLFATNYEDEISEGAIESPRQQEEIKLQVGDKVTLRVGEDKLREMQLKYGGVTAGIIKCLGKTGEVAGFAPNGAISVKFNTITYRFNPQSLLKVPHLNTGDVVRIRSDPEEMKVLNQRIGWKSEMTTALGKVGRVTRVDEDGDVVVTFGQHSFVFTPACCEPDLNASLDSLQGYTSSDAASSTSSSRSSDDSSDTSDDYGVLHQELMKLAARMLADAVGGGGLRRGGQEGRRQSSEGSDKGIDGLLRAVIRGDKDTVKSICQSNRSLLNFVHKGMTPLMVACHEGQQEVAKVLLELGAEINRVESGSTALMAALEGKKEKTALFLLEKGADPHLRNNKKRNAIHLAAYHNMPEAIKALVLKGADVNAKDQYGDTPLLDAIEQESKEAIDMLVRVKSIDLQATNRNSFNALQFSCLKGNAYATEKILQRDSSHVDKKMDEKFTALHIAANNDHVECVRLLVKTGKANVNIVGEKRLTPLHLACSEAYYRSVEALLESGANVNLQDEDGDTALHIALGVRVKNPESLAGRETLKQRARIACVLLTKGAYVDITNKKGAMPLQCCPHEVLCQTVKQFIAENPSVIKKRGGSSGGTAAQRASPGLNFLLQGLNLPCARCMRPADITLMPCGHKTLCRSCCLLITECPLCDAPIERRLAKRSDSVPRELEEACRQM